MEDQKTGQVVQTHAAFERTVFSAKKPRLSDFFKVVGEVDGKEFGGIDYVSYAFALEDYVMALEVELNARRSKQ